MTFDWSINLGTIVMLGGTIVAVVSAYWSLDRRSETRFSVLSTGMGEKFTVLQLQIAGLMEGDIRELRGRVVLLESGQAEWIKTIRERTHSLSNDLNKALLMIDRLERPERT